MQSASDVWPDFRADPITPTVFRPMADLPVNANIVVEGGAYYRVRLEWLPRAGDLVELYSFLDQASGHPTPGRYEVVRVVHELHDVTDKAPASMKGYHYVSVHVRPSDARI